MIDVLPHIFVFGVGLAVGSFLNVLILRFGFSESKQSRSHCMACNAQISSADLIPVFSYLALGGRCRVCGSKLLSQYPLVEIAVAVLFLLAFVFLPPAPSLWSYIAFASLLAFLASLTVTVVYDIRHTLVPFPFIWALGISAFTASVAQSFFVGTWNPVIDSVIGAITLGGFFLVLYFITRGRGMGLGDAYIAATVGILLGVVRGVEAVMFAFWTGTLLFLPLLLLSSLRLRARRGRANLRVTMKTELPFVPFLALGVVLALFTEISPLSFGTWLASILWFTH